MTTPPMPIVDGAKGNDSMVVIHAEEEAGREERGALDEQTKGEGISVPSSSGDGAGREDSEFI